MKQKKFLIICMVLINLVLFPIISAVDIPVEELKTRSQGKTSAGYIIQFTYQSTSQKSVELSQQNQKYIEKYNSMFFLNPIRLYYKFFLIKSDEEIRNQVLAYEKKLDNKIKKNIEEIIRELNISQSNVKSVYKKSITGIFIDQDIDISRISEKEYVYSVSKNFIGTIALSDTIQQLSIEDMWEHKDSQGNNLDATGVKIAVFDTGFDIGHDAFSQITVDEAKCFCLVPAMDDPGITIPCCPDGKSESSGQDSIIDKNGHGTHVLGILASQFGDYNGVSPAAGYYLIKTISDEGLGTSDNIIKAIEAVIDNVDIISMSIAFIPEVDFLVNKENFFRPLCDAEKERPCSDNEIREWAEEYYMGNKEYIDGVDSGFKPLLDAVRQAHEKGITVVAAAGNNGPEQGGKITAFAMIDEPIIVGSVDKSNEIAPYSSRGPAFNDIPAPDIVAPGGCHINCFTGSEFTTEDAKKGVISTKSDDAGCIYKTEESCVDSIFLFGEDNFISMEGTSMAAPHVTGIAALLKQKQPDWTPDNIQKAIKQTAIKLTDSSETEYPYYDQGAGVINPAGLLNYCIINEDCDTGYVCVDNECLTGSGCSESCDTLSDCEEGMGCVETEFYPWENQGANAAWYDSNRNVGIINGKWVWKWNSDN
ncbi:S8 family serine peptidase, partial [Candidatus Woesearchaeota archaeon]|nr:S8 family serine peptidase [Candidatus Woesearchaeota archaeon]